MVKRRGYPRRGEIVLCTVTRITPYAAWCTLDEYEHDDGSSIEGMIHISQVTGKWVRDIRKHVKHGKQYVAKVIRVDHEKGHINLSLKKVNNVDKREKMNNYRRNKRASAMLLQAAKSIGETQRKAEEKVAEKLANNYNDLFIVFEEIHENPEILKEAGISKKWRDAIIKIVEDNFQPKKITIKAELELKSYHEKGVEKIKKALKGIKKDTKADITYISAPKYLIEIDTTTPKEDERELKKAMKKAIKKVEKSDGIGEYKFI